MLKVIIKINKLVNELKIIDKKMNVRLKAIKTVEININE